MLAEALQRYLPYLEALSQAAAADALPGPEPDRPPAQVSLSALRQGGDPCSPRVHIGDVSHACGPSGLSPCVPGEWGVGWGNGAPPRPQRTCVHPVLLCPLRAVRLHQLSGSREGVPSAAGPLCSGAVRDSKPTEKNSLQKPRAIVTF